MFTTRTFCGFDDGAYVHEYSGNDVQGSITNSNGNQILSRGSTGTNS